MQKYYVAKTLCRVALVTAMAMISIGLGAADKEKKKGPPPKLAELQKGDTLTKQQMEVLNVKTTTPSKTVDTSRLEQTYKVGKTYGSLIKTSITSKGTYADWGITTDNTFNYAAEFEFKRFVESNDGKIIVMDIGVEKAVCMNIVTKIDGVNITLGPTFQFITDAGGALLTSGSLIPGWTEVTIQSMNSLMNSELFSKYLNSVGGDVSARYYAFIDGLQGKKVKIKYENGKGIVSITPLNCNLTDDEQMFFSCISISSDPYMIPDVNSKPGDSWEIDGKDFISVIDPSLRASTSGKITVVREQNVGAADNPEGTTLKTRSGFLQFNDYSENQKLLGKWAPQGYLFYSFNDKIFTEAILKGDISIERNSTDHLIFEMRHIIKPKYEIKYAAWIEDGNKVLIAPPKNIPVKNVRGYLDRILEERMPK